MFKPAETAKRAMALLGRLPLKALLIVVVFLFAVAEVGFVVQATTQRGCSWCHVPERVLAENSESSHAQVRCLDCHRTQGSLNLLELNVRAVRNLVVHMSPFSDIDASRAFVPSSTCFSCHESQIVGRLAVANNIRMRHSDVLDARIPCASCHTRALHGDSPVTGGLTHASCSFCHDGTTAGTACSVCHMTEPTGGVAQLPGIEAIVHGSEVGTIHGMGDLSACTICHARTFCKSCHGVELPHDPNAFPHLHGAQAIEARGACTDCHKQSFCDSCHQIEMPHPEGFLPEHEERMRELDRATCDRCHVPEDCQYCHTAHIHPGLPPEALEELRGPG
ncbi:MAG: NapC/NirT family cytochrome c [Actinobacteria bacterium]|nr:NapC/NirT family cytochrome c [Actinomycetota bacterium]